MSFSSDTTEDAKKKSTPAPQKNATVSAASTKGPTPAPVVVVAPVVASSGNRNSTAVSDQDKWRQSRRMMRQSRMMANNQLSGILEKVTTLERSIVAVEAARQLAEQNVIDIATAKMEEDERVVALAGKLTGVLAYMDMLSKEELRTRLTQIRDGLLCNMPDAAVDMATTTPKPPDAPRAPAAPPAPAAPAAPAAPPAPAAPDFNQAGCRKCLFKHSSFQETHTITLFC